MAHPKGTKFTGPVRSDNGFISGIDSVSGANKAISFPLSGSVAVNPASLAANSSAETAVTITGLVAGDNIIFMAPASLEAGLAYSGARVSGADTAQLRLSNVTGSAVDGASLTWTYFVIRTTTVQS